MPPLKAVLEKKPLESSRRGEKRKRVEEGKEGKVICAKEERGKGGSQEIEWPSLGNDVKWCITALESKREKPKKKEGEREWGKNSVERRGEDGD